MKQSVTYQQSIYCHHFSNWQYEIPIVNVFIVLSREYSFHIWYQLESRAIYNQWVKYANNLYEWQWWGGTTNCSLSANTSLQSFSRIVHYLLVSKFAKIHFEIVFNCKWQHCKSPLCIIRTVERRCVHFSISASAGTNPLTHTTFSIGNIVPGCN